MPANVVLLASYPKTGSTWLRKIVSEVLVPGRSSYDLIPSFLKSFPENSPAFPLFGSQCRVIKTHFWPDHERFSMFDGTITAVLSIRRHPLDVLLSSINYANVKGEAQVFDGAQVKSVEQIIADGEIASYLDRFIEKDGFEWFSWQCDRFSLYQRRWRERARDLPYLEICYEDMFADPEAAVGEVLIFLGLSEMAERVREIISTVDEQTRADGRFFWKRRAYNFETLLPAELSARFNERLRPVLDELGYGS